MTCGWIGDRGDFGDLVGHHITRARVSVFAVSFRTRAKIALYTRRYPFKIPKVPKQFVILWIISTCVVRTFVGKVPIRFPTSPMIGLSNLSEGVHRHTFVLGSATNAANPKFVKRAITATAECVSEPGLL